MPTEDVHILVLDAPPGLFPDLESRLRKKFGERVRLDRFADAREAHEHALGQAIRGRSHDILFADTDGEDDLAAPDRSSRLISPSGTWLLGRLAAAGIRLEIVPAGEGDLSLPSLEEAIARVLRQRRLVDRALESRRRRLVELLERPATVEFRPRETLQRSAAVYAGRPLSFLHPPHHLPLLDEDGSRVEGKHSHLVGFGSAWERVLGQIHRGRLETVFLEAASGSGKTTLARYIHANSSYRKGGFIHYNGGTLRGRLATELNGWRKGSFTHSVADNPGLAGCNGGCVFLDEFFGLGPEDLKPLNTIITNRRIVPHGSRTELDIDLQLIFADVRDLDRELREGRLPRDLYNRLRPHRVKLPTVQESSYALPALVCRFLEQALRGIDVDPERHGIDGAALRALARMGWKDLHGLRACMNYLAETLRRSPPAKREGMAMITLDYLFHVAEEEETVLDARRLVAAVESQRPGLPAPLRNIRDALLERGFRAETVREVVEILAGRRKHLRIHELAVETGPETQLRVDRGILEVAEILYILAPAWSDPSWFAHFLAGNTPDNMRRLFTGENHPCRGRLSVAALKKRHGRTRAELRERLRENLDSIVERRRRSGCEPDSAPAS